jgi:adenylate cyclase
MTNLVVISILVAGYAVIVTALWLIQKRKFDLHKQAKALNKTSIAHVEAKRASLTNSAEAGSSTNDQDQAQEASIAMLARADAAQRLHQTFQKFVPRQFVEHFAKGSADNLSLGYADEDEVTVMFCDIRGFTGLSEEMSPQELMNFLNAYFLRMNAPIHDNHGFIDKFIGDAIMALFDHPNGEAADKASDSVKAALDIQKALRLYNHHRHNSGYRSVKNGIGLHIGPVIIGTVGSDDRMDTTVIGDTVNIAQRIESLTAHFGVEILASQQLVNEALNNIEFAHRYVDNVVLKGKSTSIDLVEIYHHLPIEQIQAKDATKEAIAEGIELRNKLEFKKAIEVFSAAQKHDIEDPIIKHHIDTCNRLMYETEWDKKIRL